MYKIVMNSGGGTTKDLFTDLTHDNAVDLCECYGWEVADENGFVWDLEIVEQE